MSRHGRSGHGRRITAQDVLTNHRVVSTEIPITEFGPIGLVPTGEVAKAWACMFCPGVWLGPVPQNAAPCVPRRWVSA